MIVKDERSVLGKGRCGNGVKRARGAFDAASLARWLGRVGVWSWVDGVGAVAWMLVGFEEEEEEEEAPGWLGLRARAWAKAWSK